MLDQLVRLFRSYKSRGIYDNSFILVVADHGNRVADRHDENGTAHPMLWVKPIKSVGELEHSHAKTSHDKIRNLMVTSIGRDLTKKECEEILTSPSRKYVNVRPDGSLANDK